MYVPTTQFWNENNSGCLPGTLGQPSAWDDAYLDAGGAGVDHARDAGEMSFLNNNLETPLLNQFTARHAQL